MSTDWSIVRQLRIRQNYCYHGARTVATVYQIDDTRWLQQLNGAIGLVLLPFARCRRGQIKSTNAAAAAAAAGRISSIPHHHDRRVVDHADNGHRHGYALGVEVHGDEEAENRQTEPEWTDERTGAFAG